MICQAQREDDLQLKANVTGLSAKHKSIEETECDVFAAKISKDEKVLEENSLNKS